MPSMYAKDIQTWSNDKNTKKMSKMKSKMHKKNTFWLV